jgi:hypothetical protein
MPVDEYRKSARRSESRFVRRLAALIAGSACPALLIVLAAARIARAEDPAPVDWELSEQVLEIPQACIPDGAVMTCDALPPGADSASAAAVDSSSSADPASDPSAAPTSSNSSNTDEASSDPSLGNLQDYENQGIAEAPIAPVYTSGDTIAPMGPSTYFVPAVPMVLRPMATVTIARPFGSGPWMIPPHFSSRVGGFPFRGGGRSFHGR